MLSSRVSLAVGTVSLVVVTSVSTAVLVNDGTQRFFTVPVEGPTGNRPAFDAPPLVVPERPDSVMRGHVAPVARRAESVPVVPPAQAGTAPSGGSSVREVRTSPLLERVLRPVVFFPRLVQESSSPGRGKRMGKERRSDSTRGSSGHSSWERGSGKR